MDQREQEQRPVRREYGSSAAADSIGQARRVIDQLEARINDARRVPMSKTLSIVDAGELIDLIGQLRIVLPHTVVQAQAILDMRLRRLTALEVGKIQAELDELSKRIAYYLDGKLIDAYPVYAEKSVEKISFKWYAEKVFHDFFH